MNLYLCCFIICQNVCYYSISKIWICRTNITSFEALSCPRRYLIVARTFLAFENSLPLDVFVAEESTLWQLEPKASWHTEYARARNILNQHHSQTSFLLMSYIFLKGPYFKVEKN